MLQYVRSVYRRLNRPVALQVDALEDRCTPAILLPLQLPDPVLFDASTFVQYAEPMLLPTVACAPETCLVRTDLFGAAGDTMSEGNEQDDFSFAESTLLDEWADSQKPEEAAAVTAEDVEAYADESETPTFKEPMVTCAVVEYDAAGEGE